MSRKEFAALTATLKECLKSKKISYDGLAKKTCLSTPTLKRLFSGRHCNIEHIFKICEALEVSFFDLTSMAATDHVAKYILSHEQEHYFADNPQAYRVFSKLYTGQHLADIAHTEMPDKRQLRNTLSDLEKLNLLERKSDDQVVLKVKGQVHWQEDGPMSKKYYRNVGLEILEESFANRKSQNAFYQAASVELSEDNLIELKKELEDLSLKYIRRSSRDVAFLAQAKRLKIGFLFCLSEHRGNWSKH